METAYVCYYSGKLRLSSRTHPTQEAIREFRAVALLALGLDDAPAVLAWFLGDSSAIGSQSLSECRGVCSFGVHGGGWTLHSCLQNDKAADRGKRDLMVSSYSSLLDYRLRRLRDEVAATSIEELEGEIDDAVYDLFDLTEDEREVVEDYLEVF